MSTLVMPRCLLLRGQATWDNPGAFVSGGQSVFGPEPLTRRTDGGGGWRCVVQGMGLVTPQHHKTWNAFTTRWNLGDTKVVVPWTGFRLLATFAGGLGDTPWSDDTPFDDETLWESGSGFATLDADVALRATTAQIILPPGASLEGGEPFSLTGETYGTRLYVVVSVDEIEADDAGDTVTITFGPPAREAYASGADVDFERPRCTMRAVIDRAENAYPAFGRSRFTSAGMTFVETWT